MNLPQNKNKNEKKKKKMNNTFYNDTSAKNQLNNTKLKKKSRISLKYMYEVVCLYNFTDVK